MSKKEESEKLDKFIGKCQGTGGMVSVTSGARLAGLGKDEVVAECIGGELPVAQKFKIGEIRVREFFE